MPLIVIYFRLSGISSRGGSYGGEQDIGGDLHVYVRCREY